jgi:hypothetical protein
MDVDLKKEIEKAFIQEIVAKYLKDYLFHFSFMDKEDGKIFIVGNSDNVETIKLLSNTMFKVIATQLLMNKAKNSKQDKDIIPDIKQLENMIDRIIYYL